jgi:glycosidase
MPFKLHRKRALLFLLLSFFVSSAFAQAPAIEKIDPPDWWIPFPAPMLLIRGTGLANSRFAVKSRAIKIARTQISLNGHWAFLWLQTDGAKPQHITITASNTAGETSAPYEFHARISSPNAHAGFTPSDVIYLVMTDRFSDGNPANNQPGYDRRAVRGWHGGDFAGLDQHLDYLHDLGVTALWTTPIASNAAMSDSYHGYAATDLYAIDSHFGTLDDYRKVSADLHARQMKLIIDLVPNHIGVLHPWVDDPPAPEWLHGTRTAHPKIDYDFNQLIDPHAPISAIRPITNGWFTDSMPDLNQENPLVAQYLIQNALWWIETANLDGIRLDTFPYVSRHFWHDFHAATHSAYPHLTTVGEVFNGDPRVTSFFAGGREQQGPDGLIDAGLDTPFDFPTYFTIRDVLLHGKPMTALADTLRADSLYPHPERLVTFFGNHDTVRFLSEPGADPTKLRLAFGLLATLRGTPEIYSGDEIAMTGGADPENRHDFPGGFPADPANAFLLSGRNADQQSAFTWVRSLLQLRARQPALTSGDQQDLFANDSSFVFVRGSHLESGCESGERIVIALSKSEPATAISLHVPIVATALVQCSKLEPLFPADALPISASANAIEFTLPSEGFAMYRATQ